MIAHRSSSGSRATLAGLFLSACLILMMFLPANSDLPNGLFHYSSATSGSSGIAIVSSGWVEGGAIPGDTGAQFNVTVQNLNSYSIIVTSIQMNLYYPLENSSGGSVANSFIIGQIGPGDIGTAIFTLNVLSCVNCAKTYSLAMVIDYFGNNQQLNQTLGVSVSITQPKPLLLFNPYWIHSGGFVGDRNDTLNLPVVNNNPFPVESLVATILYNESILSSVSGNVATDFLSSPSVVLPGQTATLSFLLNVASDAPVNETTANVFLFYQDERNTLLNQTSFTDIPIYGNPVVSISELSQSVQIIGTSTVSFLIKDVGTTPMYTPSVSVALPTGLTVTGNFTKPSIIPEIYPGSSAIFSFNVTAGNGASLGGYRGTLTVSYMNEFGTPNKAVFTIAINVVGEIKLVIISQQVVQTLTNITVSGTILNYGTAPALATQIFVYLNETGSSSMQPLGSSFSYIGTVNPLTPSYFTVTMSYPLQKSTLPATITLRLVYENSSRISDSVVSETPYTVLPASQLSQPPGLTQTTLIVVGLISTIVIVSVISFFYFRTKRKIGNHNTEQITKAA